MIQLGHVLDAPGGADQRWLPSAKVAEMLTKVTGRDAVRLDEARRAGKPFAATTSGTRRDTVAGSVRVRTVRSDGRSGCLLSRATTNRQQLMMIDGGNVGIRNFTPRELAKLIGVPADYRLPRSTPETVRLMGDGVVVPVVRWLAANLLEPLLAGDGAAAIRPRTDASYRLSRGSHASARPGRGATRRHQTVYRGDNRLFPPGGDGTAPCRRHRDGGEAA